MISARLPRSEAAAASLRTTSEETPSSRTLRAIRWQYWPPVSRTLICAVSATRYLVILCTTSLRDEFTSAVAFGMSSSAFWTSGSVWI